MKITALLSDKLVESVVELSGGKNITESITIALKEWIAQKNIKALNSDISAMPLLLSEDFTAYKTRELNRKR